VIKNTAPLSLNTVHIMDCVQRLANFQIQGRNGYEADLALLLSGDHQTITKWSAPLTPEERTDRNNAIFDHWLAGETTRVIAIKSSLDQSTIVDIVKYMGQLMIDVNYFCR